MRKENMKLRKEALLMVLIFIAALPFAAATLSLQYDSPVILMPGVVENISVHVMQLEEKQETAAVNCTSPFVTWCPSPLSINKNATLDILVSTRWVDPSVHNISFIIGNNSGNIAVIVSNAPAVLLGMLDRYKDTFSNISISLQQAGIVSGNVEKAFFVLDESYALFRERKYTLLNAKIAELEKLLTASYKEIPLEVPSPISAPAVLGFPALLGFSSDSLTVLYRSLAVILSLVLLALLILLSFRHSRKKDEKTKFREDLSKIQGIVTQPPQKKNSSQLTTFKKKNSQSFLKRG